jgi:hypothetical protein
VGERTRPVSYTHRQSLSTYFQRGDGAAVGALGGEPAVGAAAAAINQAANTICRAELDFRIIFRAGAFDLARRVNHDLRQIPRMPELLGPILTDAERAALGIH